MGFLTRNNTTKLHKMASERLQATFQENKER